MKSFLFKFIGISPGPFSTAGFGRQELEQCISPPRTDPFLVIRTWQGFGLQESASLAHRDENRGLSGGMSGPKARLGLSLLCNPGRIARISISHFPDLSKGAAVTASRALWRQPMSWRWEIT